MPRRMHRVVVGVTTLALLALCGCGAHVYAPPRGDQPHAVVKIRRAYLTGGGTGLHEIGDLLTDDEDSTGRALQITVDSSLASSPRVDGLLVHPQPFQLTLQSEFFHTEERQVQESYQVSVPYQTTESYSCPSGYGSTMTYSTCTRMVTQYRSETRYRTVTKIVEISDGACGAKTTLRPEAGHVYLLDYVYHTRNNCELRCEEQVMAPGAGSYVARPCPR